MITLVAHGGMRLRLSSPRRPWDDDLVDFVVELVGDGLNANAVVTSLEGDALAAYLSDLADHFRGWPGTRADPGLLEVPASSEVFFHVVMRRNATGEIVQVTFRTSGGRTLVPGPRG